MARKTFYIIDGHAQIFRAYYARLPALTSPKGEPTKATHVFLQFLLNLISNRKPDYLAMTLDTSDETVFRRDLYNEYKAHREPMPEDLVPQQVRIISMVEAMGLPIFRLPGFEADDLMATMVERVRDQDIDVYLVSKDKDLDQLLTDRTFLYDPGKDEVFDVAALLKDKGYAPEKAVEVQTLSGDSVDNIPGVKGIGPKTAAKLINQYGSALEVIKNADKLTAKMAENVRAFEPMLEITRQLVTLKRDVEFPFDFDSCRFSGHGLRAVLPILEELGMNRMRTQWEQLANGLQSPEPVAIPTKPGGDQGMLFGAMGVHDIIRSTPGTGADPIGLEFESSAPVAGLEAIPSGHGPTTIREENVDYQLVDNVAVLRNLADALAKESAFAFDTETTHINPVHSQLVGLSLAWEAGKAYYVAVRGIGPSLVSEDDLRNILGPVISRQGPLKVGQNLKYDLIALRRAGIEMQGPFFDPMIAAFLIDPLRRSHGLDAMALDFLNHRMIPISDLIGKGRDQLTMDRVPTDRVCEYAAEDADYTWRLYEYLWPRMEKDSTYPLFRETEMPLVEVLGEMESNGVRIDTDMLARMSGQMADKLKELEKQIHAMAGYAFNLDSTQQLGRVLFDELKLPVIKKTKTGRSTDAETLSELAQKSDHPLPKLMLEYRELGKLKNTYIDTLPEMICERTGRIHTGFSQTGAVTGRLASSDPNLQNIPVRTEAGREIRKAFVAGAPDHVLLVADYSQIELRVLAHFCKDRALLAAFESDQDIHAFVASQVYGVALDQVSREQRSAAKAVNFGIIYGQTAFGLARGLGISRTEAEQFIRMYFMRYPGIRSFIDQCIADARRLGYVQTILGRRRPVPEIRSANKQSAALGERLAVNTVIQGSAADLIKRAMIDIHNDIRSGRLRSKMLIQVHDELVFETPGSVVVKESEIIRDRMCKAIPLDVPIKVDIGWGENWLESK